jgi:hypothetical protein
MVSIDHVVPRMFQFGRQAVLIGYCMDYHSNVIGQNIGHPEGRTLHSGEG